MLVDKSSHKKEHDAIIDYVKSQINIDLNEYRDGDGTDPSTTTYWDKKSSKVCVNCSERCGGMNRRTQAKLETLAYKSNGKLAVEWGSAWFKYIYFA